MMRHAPRKVGASEDKSPSLLSGFATFARAKAMCITASIFVRTCFYAAAMMLVALSDARAATYHYTGNLFSGHIDGYGPVAVDVELDCVGPCAAGVYIEGSGLISFTLKHGPPNHFGSSLVVSSLSPTYTSMRNFNYVRISDTGQIDSWSIQGYDPWVFGLPSYGFGGRTVHTTTSSNDHIVLCCAYGFNNEGNPGVWTDAEGNVVSNPVPYPAPVPLPPAILMFMGGLGLLGLLRLRSATGRRPGNLSRIGFCKILGIRNFGTCC
jgi:hypothetical protein